MRKEIYVCDRCGIERVKKSSISIESYKKGGYLVDDDIPLDEVDYVKGVFHYEGNMESFDMCGECTKKFREFMKNK